MAASATVVAVALLAFLALPLSPGAPHPREMLGGPSQRAFVVSDARLAAVGVAAAPVPSNETVRVTIALVPRAATVLASLDASLAAGFHGPFLTERQFEAAFRPDNMNRTTLEGYFAGFGASGFSPTADGLGLQFALSVADAERAFATALVRPQTGPDAGEITVTDPPSLPSRIAPMVAGVGGLASVGLSNLRDAATELGRPIGHRSTPGEFVVDQAGQGEVWYVGSDYAQAYGLSNLFPTGATPVPNASFPTGEAVATLLMSGYNDSAGVDLPPWDPAQILAYFNDSFPGNWPHPTISGVPVTASGTTPPAPGAYPAAETDTSFNEAENSLDLEMAGSGAPGATLVNFYFAASLFVSPSSTQTIGNIADDFAMSLSTALTYNYGSTRLAAVSNSYGLPDLIDPLWDLELGHAAATGVTVVASSGDQGNAPNDVSGRFQGPWPTWPASAAFNTTGAVSVGGASVNLTGSATGSFTGGNVPVAFDPTVTGVASQWAWYNTLAGQGNYSGTEGGVTVLYNEPDWQYRSAAQPSIANASAVQGVHALGRSEPDFAFPANVTIAYVATNASGIEVEVLQGTSVGAPFFSGWLATASGVAGHPFGFLDPELYRIASFYSARPNASSPILDVTTGGNYVFTAGSGWDPTTGWGGLDAVRFLSADADPAVRNYSYTGPTPGIPPPPAPAKPNPGLLPALVIAGLAAAIAVVLVLVVMASPRRSPPHGPPPGVYSAPPWVAGAPPATGSPPPIGAFFPCPYCGRMRPAEPGRCPSCGAM